MKEVKGRILKKLKSIPLVGYLKQTRILKVNASDGLASTTDPLPPRRVLGDLSSVSREEEEEEEEEDHHHRKTGLCKTPPFPAEPHIIDVWELMRDLEEDEEEDTWSERRRSNSNSNSNSNGGHGSKENFRPPASATKDQGETLRKMENHSSKKTISSDSGNCKPRRNSSLKLDKTSFRRPDLNSGSLFDPDLLAAFEQAAKDHIRTYEWVYGNAAGAALAAREEDIEQPHSEVPTTEDDSDDDPLMDFEERCPPGGNETVVLYTTSIRGIRKTFEDCNSVRFLLGSLKVLFFERDVSMHLEFREELWRVLGDSGGGSGGWVIPPRLFIRGRYIGGADKVLGLHEQGKLLPLVRGLQVDRAGSAPCEGCGGFRFVPCSECSGSRKVYHGRDNKGMQQSIRCPHCNENGLTICPLCCCCCCC